ncbi:peptidoglycan D,D-transpeptidase FtsI family protein [Bifidobacterium thermophilum]|uniref:peptidoglycan D,D-transpeptidase FtsI family protein n=1 Tax=Bifidobacterium thermophilum TaxID=33905 RepID=UPI003BB52720
MRPWKRLSRSLGQFGTRCVLVMLVFALVAAACLLQLGNLQLINAKSYAAAAQKGRTTTVTIKASRGKIEDTNGTVLAQSVERYDIIGDAVLSQSFKPVNCTSKNKSYCHAVNGKPVGTTGAAAVARLVSGILGIDAKTLGAQLSTSSQYVVLKKNVSPEVKRKIDKLHLGWCVYGIPSSIREYSNGTLMGSLLGGVDASGKGVSGIELMEDKTLTGTNGKVTYQTGGQGQTIPGTQVDKTEAVNGSDVKLTIDADVDWYVKKALTDGVSQFHAAWGIAVVQDVKTGAILALEDSDQVEAGSTQAMQNASRAVATTFEPGSVGKVFSMAGMLQLGLHKMTDQFTVPSTITVDGQDYKDSHEHGTSNWTLAGILQQSSNVGMIMAADKYTSEERYEFLKKFGIGQASGMNLPAESSGSLSSPSSWDGRTRNTVLFGQGYSTNVLQITNAIATIANKGVKNQQYIIKSVTDAEGHTTTPKRGEPARVVDESVASQMLNAMESVGEYYQNEAGVPGYRIAAKTGTAQVAGANGALTSIVADWVGVLPADNPRFVVTVVLKDPEGTYGGMTAGPVFKTIGEFLMQKYQVPTSSPRTDAIPVTW